MPNMHTLDCHSSSFARAVGHFGKFSEEGFKHFQSTIAIIRSQHPHNCPTGLQICYNLQYSWQQCLPDVAELRAAGECEAQKNGYEIKKSEFIKMSNNENDI